MLDHIPTTFKVMFANAIAFIFSFANIEKTLQIILLGVTIMYTIFKTFEIVDKRRKAKRDREQHKK